MANGKPIEAKAAPPPVDDMPGESIDITDTPEFQMAMAKATTEIHNRLVAEMKEILASERSAKPVSDQSDIERLARAIAMNTAELADQGTNRKRVAPEVLEARAQSTKRMHALLEEAQKLTGADRPKYRVRAKCYLGDRLIEPWQRRARGEVIPTHIYFMSTPNLAMEPINDVAKAIYAAYRGTMAGPETINGTRPDPDALGAKPVWVTNNGAIIASPTVTAREHDMVIEPDPRDTAPDTALGPNVGGQVELISVDDPRATKIPVLGTIAAPAVRGSSSPRLA